MESRKADNDHRRGGVEGGLSSVPGPSQAATGSGAVLRASVAFHSLGYIQGPVLGGVRNVDSYHSRLVLIGPGPAV
jgi:hypothetical protein